MENKAYNAIGSLYGKSLSDRWPQASDGSPVQPAFLQHCTEQDMEADMLVNLLEAYGIPCIKVYPDDGKFGKLVLGMSGTGVDLFVPETLLDDAKNICTGEIEYE